MKKSVMVILLLLIVACVPQQKKEETPQPGDFRTGTQGLAMDFLPNMPPAITYDKSDINIMLQVENKGTSEILPAGLTLFLSGFDYKIIQIANLNLGQKITSTKLDARSQFVTRGGIDALTWTGKIEDLSLMNVDKYNPLILATACYQYDTIANAQVCIDPNPFTSTNIQKVCTPAAVTLGSQGAPIAVTSVQVETQPQKTRFTINIQNVGGGTVFKDTAMVTCNPYSKGLSFGEVDLVKLVEVKASDKDLTAGCKGATNNYVRLTNGAGQIFCEFTPSSDQAFITPLTIKLTYGYRQSIAKPIEIRSTGKTEPPRELY